MHIMQVHQVIDCMIDEARAPSLACHMHAAPGFQLQSPATALSCRLSGLCNGTFNTSIPTETFSRYGRFLLFYSLNFSLSYGTSWPRAVTPRFFFFFFLTLSAPCRRLPVVSRDRLASPHFLFGLLPDNALCRSETTKYTRHYPHVHCRAIVNTTLLPREPAIYLSPCPPCQRNRINGADSLTRGGR